MERLGANGGQSLLGVGEVLLGFGYLGDYGLVATPVRDSCVAAAYAAFTLFVIRAVLGGVRVAGPARYSRVGAGPRRSGWDLGRLCSAGFFAGSILGEGSSRMCVHLRRF